ncbi:CpeS-like protein [Rubidibacter lacunae KORDI 51-2]|uniref:Chromophore lyase CpcS/CpeS n=1 Tax=Rubidibacter lacunae KORDI 51-2 TaxID=582515 RepID=U5DJS4_9CHRO|nr:phycobiliprotein lyase [Rubidibacter lacunae]ERN41941.1 CpeS-like protein [Rubidibacter lacunae KORDI 51-2]
MDVSQLQHFFDCCLGNWDIERTYHFLSRKEVERSHTKFSVRALTETLKDKVLADNAYSLAPERAELATGFQLAFHTISDKGEEVSQSLNALFVPQTEEAEGVMSGDYLRDRAYEEDRPLVSHFQFDPRSSELLMTTPYTQVVAVDSIVLLNPELRLRKILTYRRPRDGQPLSEVVLIGFGVEQKVGTAVE